MRASFVLTDRFQRYAFSIAVTTAGFLLTMALNALTERSMFQLAVAAVVISAWFGGLGPGLLSAACSTVATAYYLLEPVYSFYVRSLADISQLVVFILVAVLMSGLSEARHQAEQKLRARSDELEVANRELESFSYMVSHDLRWPLRAINGYARILLDEYAAHLDLTARRYLELIRTSTKQMDQLVQGLLDFSRLGRQPLHKRSVETASLVQQSLSELKGEYQGRTVDVRIGELPPCEGDPVLLKQVFVNLLQNALKFTRRRNPAVIEVGSIQTPKGRAYFVKDNGIGFNMQYAQQLFGVFQRLHRSEEYEGTGVGLAVVQRIIHRHGGTVWAESEVENGAVFYFTVAPEEI
jgi:light-regulated signal transduction histidine kinase (bacteriophytochrome)